MVEFAPRRVERRNRMSVQTDLERQVAKQLGTLEEPDEPDVRKLAAVHLSAEEVMVAAQLGVDLDDLRRAILAEQEVS